MGTSIAELLGTGIFIAVVLYIGSRFGHSWVDDLEVEFQAAVQKLGVEVSKLVVNRVVPPSGDRIADVYRIFHDLDRRYYLFMKVGESPGVLKPLTEERALLAARLSGYELRLRDLDPASVPLSKSEAIPGTEGSWAERLISNEQNESVQSMDRVPTTFTIHSIAVKLCLYLVVWPNIILASVLTVVAVFVPPTMILMIFAWWGLGSLLSLRQCLASGGCRPRRAVCVGLVIACGLVSYFCGDFWLMRGGVPGVLWIPAMCIPVAGYWGWLAMKGVRV